MATNKTVTSPLAEDLSRKKGARELSAPRLLAKQPGLGLILFIFGVLIFAGLTFNLEAQGPLLPLDRPLATTLPAIALKGPAFLQGLMDAGYYLGDQVLAVLTLLLGLFFIVKRLWNELVMLVLGMVGASSLFLFLSNLIARPRPPTQIWMDLTIPGFPSGHAISVVVFYGLMAYLLVPKMASALGKVLVVAIALFLILFVGFSRVFTAGHYLTDVLAGYAVGLAWASLVYTLVELYFQKRRNRNG